MDDLKLSIVIPYKQRLNNIKKVFASIADQTMNSSEFEVVVGAMEYSEDYVTACREHTGDINIRTVMTGEDWNLCRARNLAIHQARGQVIVLVDADVILPPTFLRDLYDRYFQHRQRICVVGQMIGYDEVVESDVDTVEDLPYDHYRTVLADLATADRTRLDERWTAEHASAFARFPWVYCRTGLMALPAALVREHGLLFDEGFRGWGPEDQEWGFRIAATGTPIVLGSDVYGLHLPHLRSLSANGESARTNNRYYLAKWPRLDLELALAFGWLETDRCYPEVERELAEAAEGGSLGVVRGTAGGRDVVLIGALIDGTSPVPTPELTALFDARTRLQVLPLAGFALPYPDKDACECRILPPVLRLSERYRDAILREAQRVSRAPVSPGTWLDAELESADVA